MTRALISALCPTKDRRRFLPEAIRCFQAQDWPDRELVILDDGDDPVADLVPDDPSIRYVRSAQHMTLGAKCNALVRLARGTLFHFWADDDWQAPRALRVLAEAQHRTGAALVGTHEMLFHEVGTTNSWVFGYHFGPKHLIGGSLLWTRAAWEQRPFDDMAIKDVDSKFLVDRPRTEIAFLEDWQWYVATIHPGNTSARIGRDQYTLHWRRWEGTFESVVGGQLPWWLASH